MAECIHDNNAGERRVIVPTGGYTSGQVMQLPDGRAAYVEGMRSPAAGDAANLRAVGRCRVAKAASIVVLDGAPLWWDRANNCATPLRAVTGANFFLGLAVGDAASSATELVVELNAYPRYTIDAMRDPTDTVIVLTAGTPSLTMGPGYAKLAFSTTAEAQKVDILSKQSVPVDVPWIAEGRVAIYDIGDHAAVDISIGVANDTHASDADAITESVFLHLDGAALDILAESDDGTTEVAATDTTKNAVDDTYFDFAIDARNLEDIQIYVNGVLVLPDVVFKLDAATGPLKLLVHMEKTANDTPGEIRVEKLALRAMDIVA